MCHERWALHVVIKRKVFTFIQMNDDDDDSKFTAEMTPCVTVVTPLIYIYLQFLHTIYAISIRYARLRRRKSICIPNFNEKRQSTAEIKQVLVSEDGWPPVILLPIRVATSSNEKSGTLPGLHSLPSPPLPSLPSLLSLPLPSPPLPSLRSRTLKSS